jgi:hypothetical protein
MGGYGEPHRLAKMLRPRCPPGNIAGSSFLDCGSGAWVSRYRPRPVTDLTPSDHLVHDQDRDQQHEQPRHRVGAQRVPGPPAPEPANGEVPDHQPGSRAERLIQSQPGRASGRPGQAPLPRPGR